MAGSYADSTAECLTEDLIVHSLRANSDAYESMLCSVSNHQAWHPEALVVVLEQIAEAAFTHHPGRFVDGALENILLGIGQHLDRHLDGKARQRVRSLVTITRQSERRHVLHIATGIQALGGHARTIKNWVASDRTSRHLLVVTQQKQEPLPQWMVETLQQRGGELLILPEGATLLERAMALRAIARLAADVVVLHTHGFDAVPILAFAIQGGPPVCLLDHTDHLFWMGGSVADTVVSQRHIGSKLALDRRFPKNNTVLPIPLAESVNVRSRDEARQRLGIPADQPVLLTVGRATKYIPTPTHNFIRTARKILERNPAAHLYLVGASERDLAGCRDVEGHPRLRFLGPVPDPSWHQAAADVYVEGFPFGSQTAMLEAALAGVAVVRAYAPPLDMLTTDDESLSGLAFVPADEDEYIAEAESLLRKPDRRHRFGKTLRERVQEAHLNPGWQRRADSFYERASTLTHTPAPVPVTPCALTQRDLALSSFQAFHTRQSVAQPSPAAQARQVFLAGAYRARESGHPAVAFRIYREVVRRWGWDRRTAGAIAKLLVHTARRSLRVK